MPRKKKTLPENDALDILRDAFVGELTPRRKIRVVATAMPSPEQPPIEVSAEDLPPETKQQIEKMFASENKEAMAEPETIIEVSPEDLPEETKQQIEKRFGGENKKTEVEPETIEVSPNDLTKEQRATIDTRFSEKQEIPDIDTVEQALKENINKELETASSDWGAGEILQNDPVQQSKIENPLKQPDTNAEEALKTAERALEEAQKKLASPKAEVQPDWGAGDMLVETKEEQDKDAAARKNWEANLRPEREARELNPDDLLKNEREKTEPKQEMSDERAIKSEKRLAELIHKAKGEETYAEYDEYRGRKTAKDYNYDTVAINKEIGELEEKINTADDGGGLNVIKLEALVAARKILEQEFGAQPRVAPADKKEKKVEKKTHAVDENGDIVLEKNEYDTVKEDHHAEEMDKHIDELLRGVPAGPEVRKHAMYVVNAREALQEAYPRVLAERKLPRHGKRAAARLGKKESPEEIAYDNVMNVLLTKVEEEQSNELEKDYGVDKKQIHEGVTKNLLSLYIAEERRVQDIREKAAPEEWIGTFTKWGQKYNATFEQVSKKLFKDEKYGKHLRIGATALVMTGGAFTAGLGGVALLGYAGKRITAPYFASMIGGSSLLSHGGEKVFVESGMKRIGKKEQRIIKKEGEKGEKMLSVAESIKRDKERIDKKIDKTYRRSQYAKRGVQVAIIAALTSAASETLANASDIATGKPNALAAEHAALDKQFRERAFAKIDDFKKELGETKQEELSAVGVESRTIPPPENLPTAPEDAVLKESLTHTVGTRGPEGTITDTFRNDPDFAKKLGWDGNGNIDTWAGSEAHRIWLRHVQEAIKNPELTQQMKKLGYLRGLSEAELADKNIILGRYSEMMHRIQKGSSLNISPDGKLDLSQLKFLKARR